MDGLSHALQLYWFCCTMQFLVLGNDPKSLISKLLRVGTSRISSADTTIARKYVSLLLSHHQVNSAFMQPASCLTSHRHTLKNTLKTFARKKTPTNSKQMLLFDLPAFKFE